jgi:fructose-1,6-bisphosphatase I
MELSLHYSNLESSLLKVIQAISNSSIEIEECVRYSALTGLHGEHSSEQNQNTSGDIQKKLDIISNDIMIRYLIETKCCSALLSEENDAPIYIHKENSSQTYVVAFDPLDGSSNIDCNAPIGTIFSVSLSSLANKQEQETDVNVNPLEIESMKGNQILVAGYILYGPSTELVISVNNKVERFVLTPNKRYVHIGKVVLDGTKKIYSINESNSSAWYSDMKTYIDKYKINGTKYTSRYIGSMVGDVHRTLLYGGMFCYPADTKNPNGKLRLLYEAYPMAKIIEDAGGKSIVGNNSKQRILDVIPREIHQRTPVLLGSVEEVKKYEEVLQSITNL